MLFVKDILVVDKTRVCVDANGKVGVTETKFKMVLTKHANDDLMTLDGEEVTPK